MGSSAGHSKSRSLKGDAPKKNAAGARSSRKTTRSSEMNAATEDSAPPVQYVIPLGNGWVIKSSNAKKFFAITDNKPEAVSIALQLAKTKRTPVEIYHKNGKVERRMPSAR